MIRYDPMTEYTQFNFYHEHYTLVDRFQWHKLRESYSGGPAIKWWQETAFLQGLKPEEPERQLTKRAVIVWTKEEDDFVVEMQGSVGDKEWAKKATRFNDKFASTDSGRRKTGDQIGDRWRKVLKPRVISQNKKRKLEVEQEAQLDGWYGCLSLPIGSSLQRAPYGGLYDVAVVLLAAPKCH